MNRYPEWFQEMIDAQGQIKDPETDSETTVKLAAFDPSKPVYYRWAYSPTSDYVTLSHNREAPRHKRKYHDEMEDERDEHDITHGYAYRISGGWRITDWDNKTVEDPRIVRKLREELAVREDENDKTSYREASQESQEGNKEP
jgi:hypothetical protein